MKKTAPNSYRNLQLSFGWLMEIFRLGRGILRGKHKQNSTVVLVVGSEPSQNWVRVVSGLGPIRLGSEKYQGSVLAWVRVVRLPFR